MSEKYITKKELKVLTCALCGYATYCDQKQCIAPPKYKLRTMKGILNFLKKEVAPDDK